MSTPIRIQSDLDAALADLNAKLDAATLAVIALYTVQFPATSYATAASQADALRAAGNARDAIAATLATFSDRAASVAALIKPLLPIS